MGQRAGELTRSGGDPGHAPELLQMVEDHLELAQSSASVCDATPECLECSSVSRRWVSTREHVQWARAELAKDAT